jgi:flagellum-specific ATP synthase
MQLEFDLKRAFLAIADIDAVEVCGRVLRMVGGVVEASGPQAAVGELCAIEVDARSGAEAMEIQGSRFIAGLMKRAPEGKLRIPAEVIGFRSDAILLMPLTGSIGIRPGDLVSTTRRPLSVSVGDELLGRVLGGLGQPIDGKGMCRGAYLKPLTSNSPAPLDRSRIREQLTTGIRAIDGLLSCGKGQRLGIFAGSGVGKSVLLGSIARHAKADVNVIALIGERGREVREFLERDLGDGLAKSVVVVATSDQPPLVRIRGAMAALTIAEYFRGQGKDVLFMMDSLTRVAMAQREIGLAAGEPPTTKGYPPSVFSTLPALLERVGNARSGSITGLFAVLVEADDMNEPISDAARSILDGHVALSRRFAQMGHYPAINVLESVSRVMPDIVSDNRLHDAEAIRRVLAVHAEAEDVINLGAYVNGSNLSVDDAISRLPGINEFLCQRPGDHTSQDETFDWIERLVRQSNQTATEEPVAPVQAVADETGFRPLSDAVQTLETAGTPQ